MRQLCFRRPLDNSIARGKSRQRERAQRASRQFLDIAQMGPLLVAAKRDRGPGGAGTRSSANAMHVIFGHVRQFEIDDVRHPVDIDAAGGNVGGDKHPGLAVAKAGERSFALRLGFVAVDGGRLDAGTDQVTHNTVGAMLGSGKYQHACKHRVAQ
jgi:hypothetical protein